MSLGWVHLYEDRVCALRLILREGLTAEHGPPGTTYNLSEKSNYAKGERGCDLEPGKSCGASERRPLSPWRPLARRSLWQLASHGESGVAVRCQSRGRMNGEIWTLYRHARFSSGLSC